jgi:hypothetical protein
MKNQKNSAVSLVLGLLLAIAPLSWAEVDTSRAANDRLANDRLEVMQLSSKYAWGIDTMDRDLLATVFAKNAVADYVAVGDSPLELNEHLVGFETIFSWLHKSLGHRKGTAGLPWHYVTNQVVELHGDRADLRYYMHNRPMAAGGVYYVKAVRTAEGWRIERLRLEEQLWNSEFYSSDKHASQHIDTGDQKPTQRQ